jgi:hypothetical protein
MNVTRTLLQCLAGCTETARELLQEAREAAGRAIPDGISSKGIQPDDRLEELEDGRDPLLLPRLFENRVALQGLD